MEKLSFKLQDFEGPLDLLLHLLSKHKMNIFEISITQLLEQYMAFIRKAQEDEMEVSSAFIEMASRLVYIKVASLLPRREEEERLREELSGQLLEYQACKQAAAALASCFAGYDIFTRQRTEVDCELPYALTHPPVLLFEAYRTACGKKVLHMAPSADTFRPLVSQRVVSVSSRVFFVLKKLYRRPQIAVDELFETGEGRGELVATFLAVLELLKSGRLSLSDNGNLTLNRRKGGKAIAAQ